MNSIIAVTKQTSRNIYIKIEFQSSIVRLRFLCRITDNKIASINPCIGGAINFKRGILLCFLNDLLAIRPWLEPPG